MKKYISALICLALVAVSSLHAQDHAPETYMHVVTVSWKEGTTDEQIQAALDGVHKMAADFDGILRVWTKTVKAQGERTHAFVMEFKSEEALKEYAGSDVQKAWYELYIPIRARSTTFGISN